jgi:hypothetical protein
MDFESPTLVIMLVLLSPLFHSWKEVAIYLLLMIDVHRIPYRPRFAQDILWCSDRAEAAITLPRHEVCPPTFSH